jgi:sulfinoalanine decarboxylase/sulfinoalanine decarboxylase/aspartate 1-decarboxylase
MKSTLEQFNYLVKQLLLAESEQPVTPFLSSDELFETVDLDLEKEALGEEEFMEKLEEVVLRSTRTATPGFFNQLFGGRNPKAVLGDLLAVVLNNSMYTYKAAGVQIGVEKALVKAVNKEIGWDEQSGGTFGPGGSMTNLMAMIMARDKISPEVANTGTNGKLTVYTSSESHYSIPKNAAFCGIGREQIRFVPSDSRGRIQAQVMEEMVQGDLKAGYTPALVNLTAGTTVLGAFDPIEEIASLCERHHIWLHVDGAYCGSVIFSGRYRHLLSGLEKVDSFSLNAHKMVGTPLSCSMILVKDERYLFESFSNDASYLYQTDHDAFNPGKTSLQCGRRNDALKFWTLWKRVGTNGLEAIIDKQFELAYIARDYIKNHPDYTLYSYPDSISICFNYKGIPARKLCTDLYEQSVLMVGYGQFRGQEFVRMVTVNAQLEREDILGFFQKLERFVALTSEVSVLADQQAN